jgi:hypothetical protein
MQKHIVVNRTAAAVESAKPVGVSWSKIPEQEKSVDKELIL